MDAINNIVANTMPNTGQLNLSSQTVISADFMQAFVEALGQGHLQQQQGLEGMTATDGLPLDFEQLLALSNADLQGTVNVLQTGNQAQIMNYIAENAGVETDMVENADVPTTDLNPEAFQKPNAQNFLTTQDVKVQVTLANQKQMSDALSDTAVASEQLRPKVDAQTGIYEGATARTERQTVLQTDGLAQQMAENVIMTGGAKDFSAGYLNLISNSTNAVDLQTILGSLETLNGSITQSLGLINAIENSGVSDFLGIADATDTTFDNSLSAEQLVMLSLLSGANDDANSNENQLIELLLDENYGEMGNLDSLGTAALLGGFSDYSAADLLDVLSTTGNIGTVLSAFSDNTDENENSLFSNSGGFTASSLLNSILGTNSGDTQSNAIPLSSVVPLNTLRQLSAIEQRDNLSKLETLAKAFENGEATVSRMTEYVAVDDSVRIATDAVTDDNTETSANMEFSHTEKLVGESNFANAVREAKKNVGNENATEKAEGFSVNASTVATDSTSANEVVRENSDTISTTEVFRQTAEQISAKLSQRYEEVETFSVRLNPEGLGEVVVNLEKTDDGVVLSLAASETKTAEMLGNQMNELQSALSQFNATVTEIKVFEPQQSQTQSYLQQDFSENYQGSNGESYRQGTPRYTRAQETIENTVENVQTVFRDNSRINTYI